MARHKTPIVRVDPVHPEPAVISVAAAVIRRGGLCAFPTETVYGLGADAFQQAALEAIFAAKGRPRTDPLIVHLGDIDALPLVCSTLPAGAMLLAEQFWPGPLTLLLPRHPSLPYIITAGHATVAVRIPNHPVARALLRAAGTPIAAPSANRFGHTSPTTAAHVADDLAGRINIILDGGATSIGLESTILDITTPIPVLCRPGAISVAQLEECIGSIAVAMPVAAPQEPQIAPGQLERHYAPHATMWLCIGTEECMRAWLKQQTERLIESGYRVGLLIPDDDIPMLAAPDRDIESLGRAHDLAQVAHRFYAALRALDARQPDIILARDFGCSGLALALRDRLMRAASGRVTYLAADTCQHQEF